MNLLNELTSLLGTKRSQERRRSEWGRGAEAHAVLCAPP